MYRIAPIFSRNSSKRIHKIRFKRNGSPTPTISAAMLSKSNPVGVSHSEIKEIIKFIVLNVGENFTIIFAITSRAIPTKADKKNRRYPAVLIILYLVKFKIDKNKYPPIKGIINKKIFVTLSHSLLSDEDTLYIIYMNQENLFFSFCIA